MTNPSHPYASEERRLAAAAAYRALEALTPEERTRSCSVGSARHAACTSRRAAPTTSGTWSRDELNVLIVNPLHWYHREAHLAEVVEEMRRRGPPRIRAYWDDVAGIWHAQEGTHRLRAAKQLGLVPTMIPVPWPRTRAALNRARHAARRHAHRFD